MLTKARIYSFACSSKHELNIWLRKIRFSAKLQTLESPKMANIPSFTRFGSKINIFGKTIGRALGVTAEHVVSCNVLRTDDVMVERLIVPENQEVNSLSLSINERSWRDLNMIPSKEGKRRASMPAAQISHSLMINSMQSRSERYSKKAKRRASVPVLTGNTVDDKLTMDDLSIDFEDNPLKLQMNEKKSKRYAKDTESILHAFTHVQNENLINFDLLSSLPLNNNSLLNMNITPDSSSMIYHNNEQPFSLAVISNDLSAKDIKDQLTNDSDSGMSDLA